jgi:hypothetical protein
MLFSSYRFTIAMSNTEREEHAAGEGGVTQS